MKPTRAQAEIIALPGNLIVKASAGTGKTYTMVNKISKEISENRTHKVVAALTFTIKAAREIKNRISIDTFHHFIGTNHSFAIEEVIKPFMKDVYGQDYDIDMDTDYLQKIELFHEGIAKIKTKQTIGSYDSNKLMKNFVFELALDIVKKSEACRLYLQSKYFKIYIDEYQDCDREMHEFFMYLCEILKIETFIVGDEKQSIYLWTWGGKRPELFLSAWNNKNFEKKRLMDNHRSCQQIQNYSNLLCEETSHLYQKTENLENIVWISTTENHWAEDVLKYIDSSKKSAFLRYKNIKAREGAQMLTNHGLNCTFIPQTPIATITTESAWIYSAVAKYIILEHYSSYDFISEIPFEGGDDKTRNYFIKGILKDVETSLENWDWEEFEMLIESLASHLGYSTRKEHIQKLYNTIVNTEFHVAFEPENYPNIAITFHSSKGLEFDQVIVFAEDYHLSNEESIYNHYVAVTRAESKLIIVKIENNASKQFQRNLSRLFSKNGLYIPDLVMIP